MPRSRAKIDDREKRLVEIDDELQKLLDESTRASRDRAQFKFSPQDSVLCLSAGYFFEGEVQVPFHVAPDVDIKAPKTKRPKLTAKNIDSSTLVTYMIRFPGWIESQFNEEIPENELILRNNGTPERVFGMLYAHEWNLYQREKRGMTTQQLGAGLFELSDEDYLMLEKQWQEERGTAVPFGEYCGRT